MNDDLDRQVKQLRLADGDVVMLHVREDLTVEQVQRCLDRLRRVLDATGHHVEVLILTGGTTLEHIPAKDFVGRGFVLERLH